MQRRKAIEIQRSCPSRMRMDQRGGPIGEMIPQLLLLFSLTPNAVEDGDSCQSCVDPTHPGDERQAMLKQAWRCPFCGRQGERGRLASTPIGIPAVDGELRSTSMMAVSRWSDDGSLNAASMQCRRSITAASCVSGFESIHPHPQTDRHRQPNRTYVRTVRANSEQ